MSHVLIAHMMLIQADQSIGKLAYHRLFGPAWFYWGVEESSGIPECLAHFSKRFGSGMLVNG